MRLLRADALAITDKEEKMGEKSSKIAEIIKYFEDIKKYSDSAIALLNAPVKAEEEDEDSPNLFDYTVQIQDAIEEIRDLIFDLEE